MPRALLLVGLAGLFLWPGSGDSHRRNQEDARAAKDLEARVARLEQILFATTKLSVYDAQRNLAAAESRLKDSERLFLRGLLDEFQLQSDRYAAERAREEVRLAQCDDDAQVIAAHIDLREAEYELTAAERRLEYAQRQANYPRGSLQEIDLRQAELERARIRLEAAQARFAAVGK